MPKIFDLIPAEQRNKLLGPAGWKLRREQKQDKQEEQRLCTPEEFQRAWDNLGF